MPVDRKEATTGERRPGHQGLGEKKGKKEDDRQRPEREQTNCNPNLHHAHSPGPLIMSETLETLFPPCKLLPCFLQL